MRIMNIAGRMIVHNGFSGGNAWQNAFASAGKAGEEMRLDKSFGDQQIGFTGNLI